MEENKQGSKRKVGKRQGATKPIPFSVSMPPELVAAVTSIAEIASISKSKYIQLAIEEKMQRDSKIYSPFEDGYIYVSIDTYAKINETGINNIQTKIHKGKLESIQRDGKVLVAVKEDDPISLFLRGSQINEEHQILKTAVLEMTQLNYLQKKEIKDLSQSIENILMELQEKGLVNFNFYKNNSPIVKMNPEKHSS